MESNRLSRPDRLIIFGTIRTSQTIIWKPGFRYYDLLDHDCDLFITVTE